MRKRLARWIPFFVSALIGACVAAFFINKAYAQSVVGGIVYTVNTGSKVTEAAACNSGTSPCTIGASATAVLSANPNRHECLLQNVGTTSFVCLKGAGTVSTSNYAFALKAGTAANDGTGGSYSCNQGPVVWTGAVSCISSGAGGSLAVSGD